MKSFLIWLSLFALVPALTACYYLVQGQGLLPPKVAAPSPAPVAEAVALPEALRVAETKPAPQSGQRGLVGSSRLAGTARETAATAKPWPGLGVNSSRTDRLTSVGPDGVIFQQIESQPGRPDK